MKNMTEEQSIEKTLKCKVLRAGGIVLILCLVVVGVYFYEFHGMLSDKAETWGAFGDFVGGICSLFLTAMNIWIFYELTKTIAKQDSEREQDKQEYEKLKQRVLIQSEEMQDFSDIVNELFSSISHEAGMCKIRDIDIFPELVHRLEQKKGSEVFWTYQSPLFTKACQQLSNLNMAVHDEDYDWKEDTYEERCYRKLTMLKEIERGLRQEYNVVLRRLIGV